MFVLFYEITFGLGREAHAIGEKMSQSGIVSARSCRTVAADCMGDEALGSFHTQRLAPGADNPFPQGNVRRFPIYPLLTHRNGKPGFLPEYEKTRRKMRRVHDPQRWITGLFLPRTLLVSVRLQPFAALVLRHLESTFLFEIAHGNIK